MELTFGYTRVGEVARPVSLFVFYPVSVVIIVAKIVVVVVILCH